MDLQVNLPKGTGQKVKVAVLATGNGLLSLFLYISLASVPKLIFA